MANPGRRKNTIPTACARCCSRKGVSRPGYAFYVVLPYCIALLRKRAVIDFDLDHPASYTDADQSVKWLLYDQDGHRESPIKVVHYDGVPHSSADVSTRQEQLNRMAFIY